MQKYIVAVLNSLKARLFVLEPAEFPEFQASPILIEKETLLSSVQEQPDQELWSNTKPGRNRGVAGQAHGYDDHRENHRIEFERRFAQEFASAIVPLIESYQPQSLLLIAEPQVLGIVRAVLSSLPKSLKLNELTKDLCHLKAHELHEYLAAKELLPAQNRAGAP